MSLNIVLMGTGEFALPPFQALIQSDKHNVVGVYTQPDRAGRGHHRHINKVKQLAETHGVPVFQPENVNTPESLKQLTNLTADVFVVAAYGQIMRKALLAIPRLGAFNLHGSLLPKHRGAAPVQYSIWKGDRQTGVTMFQIEPSLDSGPMVGKVVTDIGPKETSGELMMRLADLSVGLTLDVVGQLDEGTAVFEVQNSESATLAPKIGKDEGVIDWNQPAAIVDCHVRAMQPWPKASTWLHCDGRKPTRCIIIDVDVDEFSSPSSQPGTIQVADRILTVECNSGGLRINTIQPDGKKPMVAAAFINGYGISNDACFRSDDQS